MTPDPAAPDETERVELAEAETEHRLQEFYLRDPEMAMKDHANTLTVLSECIRKNAELRAESAHRRDALHHAWAERDRLRVQVAELKAGRAAGTPPGLCLCRFGSTCDVCGPVPADRGPLTPHPPPWPADEP